MTAYVRASHMGGKVFLRLREEDLEAEGLNIRWRRLMMEAVRKLRRDCLKGRIWGFEGGDRANSTQEQQQQQQSGHARAGTDESVHVAVQEAIAQWQASQPGLGPSSPSQSSFPQLYQDGTSEEHSQAQAAERVASGHNRDTLKRLRAKKQIKGVIAAFESSSIDDVDDEEEGFVAISRRDSFGSMRNACSGADCADHQEQSPSTRAREELAEAYGQDSGWVRKRAESYSSLREEFIKDNEEQHQSRSPPSASQSATPYSASANDSWSDTLSEDEAAALASELDEEELKLFADELDEIDRARSAAIATMTTSAAQQELHTAAPEAPLTVVISDLNLHRQGSEFSSDSSAVEGHEAFTPADIEVQDPFVAANVKSADSLHEDNAGAHGEGKITHGLDALGLGLLPYPASREAQIMRVSTVTIDDDAAMEDEQYETSTMKRKPVQAHPRETSLPSYESATAVPAPITSSSSPGNNTPVLSTSQRLADRGSDYTEEELAAIRAEAAGLDADEEDNFISPKFGTARRRAKPSPRIVQAFAETAASQEKFDVAALAQSELLIGQDVKEQQRPEEPVIESESDETAPASQADSIRSLQHMRNMSQHSTNGISPYAPLGRRTSQRAAATFRGDLPEEEKLDAIHAATTTTTAAEQLADIVSNTSETPMLMTEDEVKLVESLGLSARSQGTLGSRRSKGVAKLLRKQESNEHLGSIRGTSSRMGSLRVSKAEGKTAFGAPSKMMALFDVPEVKSPEVGQESPVMPSASEATRAAENEAVPADEPADSKIRIPLYTIEPTADGKGSTKKRSMVLVERKRFESLARRMGALEDQLAELDSAKPSPASTPHLRQMFDEQPLLAQAKPELVEKGVQGEELDEDEEEEEEEEEEEQVKEAATKSMLSLGAIPSYMLGLGAGVGFVILSEVLGKFAARR